MQITPRRQVIIDALARQGELTWTQLRLAYYGPERAAAKASTSFHNQLTAMVAAGLVVRVVNASTGAKSYKLSAAWTSHA